MQRATNNRKPHSLNIDQDCWEALSSQTQRMKDVRDVQRVLCKSRLAMCMNSRAPATQSAVLLFQPLKSQKFKKKIASVSSKIGTTRYVLNNAQAKDVFIINFSSDGQFVPFHISAWIVQCCSSCSSESLSNDKIIVHRRLSAEMYQNFHQKGQFSVFHKGYNARSLSPAFFRELDIPVISEQFSRTLLLYNILFHKPKPIIQWNPEMPLGRSLLTSECIFFP